MKVWLQTLCLNLMENFHHIRNEGKWIRISTAGVWGKLSPGGLKVAGCRNHNGVKIRESLGKQSNQPSWFNSFKPLKTVKRDTSDRKEPTPATIWRVCHCKTKIKKLAFIMWQNKNSLHSFWSCLYFSCVKLLEWIVNLCNAVHLKYKIKHLKAETASLLFQLSKSTNTDSASFSTRKHDCSFPHTSHIHELKTSEHCVETADVSPGSCVNCAVNSRGPTVSGSLCVPSTRLIC